MAGSLAVMDDITYDITLKNFFQVPLQKTHHSSTVCCAIISRPTLFLIDQALRGSCDLTFSQKRCRSIPVIDSCAVKLWQFSSYSC
jgi:hypothetical protein